MKHLALYDLAVFVCVDVSGISIVDVVVVFTAVEFSDAVVVETVWITEPVNVSGAIQFHIHS